jgi:hypothetical protein
MDEVQERTEPAENPKLKKVIYIIIGFSAGSVLS